MMSDATAHNPPDDRLRGRDWLFALGVALLAILIRLPCATKGLWIDEYYTLLSARMNLANLIAERMQIGHLPLYFIYAKLALLLGDREWMLRLTSLVPLGITIVLLTGLSIRLGLRRYLTAIWLLALFNPYWVTIGTEYRYMMLVVMSATATAWTCVEYARRPSMATGALLLATSILMVMVHPTSLFGVLALFAFLSWNTLHHRRRFSIQVFSHPIPFFLTVLSIAPMLWLIRKSELLNRPALLPVWDKRWDDLLEVSFGRTFLWHEALRYHHISFNQYIIPSVMAVVLAASIWGARRELLRRGHRLAWRLIISLFVVFPVGYLIFSATIVNIQGAARYWCILSIPVLLMMALAWHAPMPRKARIAYRALTIVLIGAQFVATMFDRGDLQREAVQWIIRNHTPGDQILIARGNAYYEAFHYLGFQDDRAMSTLYTSNESVERVVQQIRASLADHSRLLLLLYRPKADMDEVLDVLEDSGNIRQYRRWKLNDQTSVVAIARTQADLTWLKALPPVRRPFGTSRGDE